MTASLYLFPSQPSIVDTAIVIKKLQQMNVIAETFVEEKYLLGNEFMHLITFAGCSPYLKLEPNSNSDTEFCHFSYYEQASNHKLLISHTQARPRCPNCNKTIPQWKEHIKEWESNPLSMVQCQACKKENTAFDLNWKRYAAKGGFLLQFHNIFPGEAIPSDHLLAELSLITNTKWQFSWADSFNF